MRVELVTNATLSVHLIEERRIILTFGSRRSEIMALIVYFEDKKIYILNGLMIFASLHSTLYKNLIKLNV